MSTVSENSYYSYESKGINQIPCQNPSITSIPTPSICTQNYQSGDHYYFPVPSAEDFFFLSQARLLYPCS